MTVVVLLVVAGLVVLAIGIAIGLWIRFTREVEREEAPRSKEPSSCLL